MKATDILRDYTEGKLTLDEANAKLAEAGAGFTLNPDRNTITAEELAETHAGDTPESVNGYGLMDHGVGCMEKVHVVGGKTVDVDMGAETAFVYIAGKCYNLVGDTLTEG